MDLSMDREGLGKDELKRKSEVGLVVLVVGRIGVKWGRQRDEVLLPPITISPSSSFFSPMKNKYIIYFLTTRFYIKIYLLVAKKIKYLIK